MKTAELIAQIDLTFSKDDLQSAPRAVLEQLIISVYDGLLQLQRD